MNMAIVGANGSLRVGASSARKLVSVVDLLTWAFRDECARLEFNQMASVSDERAGIDPVYRLMEGARLGCRVDGGGRSEPHPDADIVAAAVSVLPTSCGGERMALTLAECAKSGSAPDWMKDAQPRFYPADVFTNRHGRSAKTVDAATLPGGWPPTKRRNRKQVLVEEGAPLPALVLNTPSESNGHHMKGPDGLVRLG